MASSALRDRPAEFIERAVRGETFLVLRYGTPMAVLRALAPGDAGEGLPVSMLSRDIGRSLRRARREAVILTYHGSMTAILAPPPRKWIREVAP